MLSYKNPTRTSLFLLLSLALTGCFRPLYADNSTLSSTNKSAGVELSKIDIAPIAQSRTGVLLRNDLIFTLTGGGVPASGSPYRLNVTLQQQNVQQQIEPISTRSMSMLVSMSADYTLSDSKTGAKLYSGRTFARASYDRDVQRFANIRAEREAEDRASKQLAEGIRNGLAGYFARTIK